jgi:quinol monooxygenase YgiN
MRALALGCVMAMCSSVATISWADDQKDKVVRIAKLVIDPNQLAAYHAAVKEEMADSVRLEPGVLAIYSVAEKEHPNRIHFFEIYASDAAYRSHIASPHFQKYVKTTQPMILSRELLETEPVQLNSKNP